MKDEGRRTKFNIFVLYKKSIYKINFKDGLCVFKHVLWLFTRRWLRLLKRIAIRSKVVFLVGVIAIIVSMLTIIPFGYSINEYNSFYDVLWDMRLFLLTSFFIVLANLNINEEKKRREGLQSLFNTYTSFMYDTEDYIKEILKLINLFYQENIYLTEESYEKFEKLLINSPPIDNSVYFYNIDYNKYKTPYLYMIFLHKRHIDSLRYVLTFLSYTKDNEINIEETARWVSQLIRVIEEEILLIENLNEDYAPKDLHEFITETLLMQNLQVIANLRRPWRWDHERNMKIRLKLKHNGEHFKGIFDTNEYWL